MLNDSDAVNRSTANGVTTVFAYTFKIYAKTEIAVYSNATLLTVDVDYTVDGIGNDGGGNVTISSAPSNGVIVTRMRNQPTVQTSHYQSEAFPPARIEKDFDKLAMLLQQTKEHLRRCWTFVKSSSTVDQTIDTPTEGLFARAKVGGGVDWATPAAVNASLPLAIADGGTGATDAATARANLLISPLDVSEGGTGATTAGGARANLLDYTENTLIDAKGDLLSGQVDNVLTRTAVSSTNGDLLIANSAATGGISWSPRVHPNVIINGAFDIWQRGTTFAALASGSYAADRFKLRNTSAAVMTINRSTDVPTVAEAGQLFNYSLEVDLTTADTSIAAADLCAVQYAIEGYDWRAFAQRACILSFWVKSPKSGWHSVGFANSGSNRTYVGQYSVSVADTWEWKTITLSASPSAGTWDYTTGVGCLISFNLAAGADVQIAADSWQTTAFGNAPASFAQVNCLDSTSNYFRITGITFQLGSVATPFPYKSFAQELAQCQRYYQKSFLFGTAPAQNVGFTTGEEYITANKAGAVAQSGRRIRFRVPMRGAPTMTSYNTSAANAQFRDTSVPGDCTGAALNAGSSEGFYPSYTGHASTAVGSLIAFHWTAEAEL